MNSLSLYFTVIFIFVFNSFSFDMQQLTNHVSQEKTSSYHMSSLPHDILFTIVTDDKTRNLVQKTCTCMNRLFSIKKPIIELISHPQFHTNEKNKRMLALNFAWYDNLKAVKILSPTIGSHIFYSRARGQESASTYLLNMLQSDDINLIEEKLLEPTELDVLCKVLFAAIEHNDFEYTKMIACHIKNKIMVQPETISLNDWLYFVNVLNYAIKSEKPQAIDALSKSGCLNTQYTADDGNKFSVLAWMKHRHKIGNHLSCYEQHDKLIKLYVKYGANSIVKDTQSGTYQCCTIL